jgi:hypothetical protein
MENEILTKLGGRVYQCLNLEVKGLRNAAVNGISFKRMKIPLLMCKVLWFMMITLEPHVDMLKSHLWRPDHLLSKSNCLGTTRAIFKSQQTYPDFSHHCHGQNGLRAHLVFCPVGIGISSPECIVDACS